MEQSDTKATNGSPRASRASRSALPTPTKKAPKRRKLNIQDNATTLGTEAPLDSLPPSFVAALGFAEAMGTVIIIAKGADAEDESKEVAFLSIVRADGRPV